VGDDSQVVHLRQLGDAQALGDAAGAGDVGLDDIDLASLDQITESPAGGVPLNLDSFFAELFLNRPGHPLLELCSASRQS